VRVAAIEALCHLTHPHARAALREAAQSPEIDIQRAALIGLGMTGDPECLPLLLSAARADDAATRLIALSALAKFDSAQVLPALQHATRDADAGVRAAALASLATRAGQEATTALIELLDSSEAAAAALAALVTPQPGRVAGVLHALETADDELAARLTSILARLERAEPTGALLSALQSRNPAARKAVAGALYALGTPGARTALEHRAQHDTSDEVRRVCALLLSR
jgi:HEAT repeat protein